MKKRLAIIGAGESGVGAAQLALKEGFEVFVSDKSKIKEKYKSVLNKLKVEWEEETHSEDRILSSDEIIKSPGIPDTAPLIKKAQEKGIPVISEIEFAARYSKAHLTCITGSNGKTTTAYLMYHVYQKAGLDVGLAGNVGQSFAKQVAEGDRKYFVLELSSFQLDGMFDFKADIAVLLNITPDHLDRYEYKMENYVASKMRILQNMDENGSFIYWADDEFIPKAMKNYSIKAKCYPFSDTQEIKEGASLDKINEKLQININNQTFEMSIHDLALQGKHNLYNSMASGISGRILDLRKELIRESLSDFQNIEHRLEHVTNVHGIEFINDSKATNVNSTWYALESMGKPTVWIVGGVDKGNDYSMLFELVKDKVKAIICLGTENQKIVDAFGDKVEAIVQAKTAREAVTKAYELATKGDVVLLSPACASFDLFENYEDRGHQFKTAVRSL
jgi:UDP-N-acetylmuramoylalanine--D-glutamate ligase